MAHDSNAPTPPLRVHGKQGHRVTDDPTEQPMDLGDALNVVEALLRAKKINATERAALVELKWLADHDSRALQVARAGLQQLAVDVSEKVESLLDASGWEPGGACPLCGGS